MALLVCGDSAVHVNPGDRYHVRTGGGGPGTQWDVTIDSIDGTGSLATVYYTSDHSGEHWTMRGWEVAIRIMRGTDTFLGAAWEKES